MLWHIIDIDVSFIYYVDGNSQVGHNSRHTQYWMNGGAALKANK